MQRADEADPRAFHVREEERSCLMLWHDELLANPASRSLRCREDIAAIRSSKLIMSASPCAGLLDFGLPGFQKRNQLGLFGCRQNDFQGDQLMSALSGLAVADSSVAQTQRSPVFDPFGTVTVTGPPMVGTSIRAPSTASFKVTGTST